MVHELKCVQPYFDLVNKGQKKFEIRKNDRDFKIGDLLALQEYDIKTNSFTGREVLTVIHYVLKDCPEYGLKDGFCILSIEILNFAL